METQVPISKNILLTKAVLAIWGKGDRLLDWREGLAVQGMGWVQWEGQCQHWMLVLLIWGGHS